MKRSAVAVWLTFLVLIPATLFLGSRLPGRSYYITGTLMIIEMMIPLFLAFEGRKPQARELVMVAVMCAIAIVGRVAMPIPNMKAAFAVIFLAAMAFGPETGFVVGAVTAFASNFFYGQGPYTPWQMMAYGAGGMLAGFVFRNGRVSRQPIWLAVFGFLGVFFWVGPLLDCAHVFLMLTNITWQSVTAVFVSGLYMNMVQAVSTAVILFLLGKPMLEKLERIKTKYGLLDEKSQPFC